VSVFIDTSAILAILDAADHRHNQAENAWTALMSSDEEIITSNYILVETTSLLHSRFGTAAVRQFTDIMVPTLTVYWVDESLHNIAAAVVTASPNRGPSLVDCVSFEIIRRQRIDSVFAYDRHFEKMGYSLIGQGN